MTKTTETREVAHLPLPEKLEPKASKRTLMQNVRGYFYTLFNSSNGSKFKKFLASVGNSDSVTGNRLFDRYEAVNMIKAVAENAKDSVTLEAKAGDIYKCIVGVMRTNGMGLKLRRAEYKRLTHAQPAE